MVDDSKSRPDLSALRIDRDRQESYSGGKRLKTILWIAIPLLIIAIIIVAFASISPTKEVRLTPASLLTKAQAQSVLSATGYVVAERQASVASKGTGRLEWLGVEEGDTVARGQIIGRIENADMMAALDLAKANLEQAKAESTQAILNYNREQQLKEKGFTTDASLEASRAGSESASAAVKSAAAGVKAAEVNLENTFIRAPFDGTVLTKHADVGEVVAPFASSASSKGSVVDLADMHSLEVEADVSESNIQRVEVGQPCEIILDAYPTVHYQGHVKKIVPTADRSRATVLTKVAFTEIDSRVLPEMSARINFLRSDTLGAPESNDTTLAVLSSALIKRDNRSVVFVVSNNKVQEIAVTTGEKLGNLTQVISGLRTGQKVITSPPVDLKAGDKVKIIE
ncbi:MAG TPA: efflux RND transporter periplasmic adaptor subunit [candidate division Zixibacteria bacterium]|jgi:RND family efflux transporter MFP subunit|nr:efflux RND transporter periplasmic adaptor subunit [candidate division Zixibacteria bacterium]HBZ00613.1 efflux RND transporter periplasmic adaptor subunit [candidate division Zixibacteria bacterium]